MDKLSTSIEIGEIIGKYIANKESKKELDQLRVWLKANPANQQLFDSIKQQKNIGESVENFDKYQSERAWENIIGKIRTKSIQQNLFRWKIAAIFFFLVGVGLLVEYIISRHNSDRFLAGTYTTVSTKYGQNSKIVLPDSSVVWINSGSELSYSNSFAISNRRLKLKGQAFFQVTKNKKVPFIVESKHINIKVLGTRFDVSAYPEDNIVRVVLERGKVEILKNQSGIKNVDLKPGEKATYDINEEKLFIEKVDSHIYSSWRDGMLIFRDEKMVDVIRKLERWYNITIEVEDSQIYNKVFTATIVNEEINEILDLIRFTCSVNYKLIPSKTPDIPIKILLFN